jgi:hypothetical protein
VLLLLIDNNTPKISPSKHGHPINRYAQKINIQARRLARVPPGSSYTTQDLANPEIWNSMHPRVLSPSPAKMFVHMTQMAGGPCPTDNEDEGMICDQAR